MSRAEPEVLVLRTGTANIASVLAGLSRAGGRGRLSDSPEELLLAERVVVPGVGSFGAAMEALRRHGLDAAICERAAADRPILGICVGHQVLCEASEEDPGVAGLGLVPGEIGRFEGDLRIPQMGWNKTEAASGCRVLRSGHFYFANSYRLPEPPARGEFLCATAVHGAPFVAGLERGSLVSCQFHPELSGALGGELLQAFVSQDF